MSVKGGECEDRRLSIMLYYQQKCYEANGIAVTMDGHLLTELRGLIDIDCKA